MLRYGELRTPPSRSAPTPCPGTLPRGNEFFLVGSLEVDSEMQKRFAGGTGVIHPYGHIVELQSEERHVAKKIVKK